MFWPYLKTIMVAKVHKRTKTNFNVKLEHKHIAVQSLLLLKLIISQVDSLTSELHF